MSVYLLGPTHIRLRVHFERCARDKLESDVPRKGVSMWENAERGVG